MFTMSMKSNIDEAARRFKLQREQINLAAAKALTFTAERVRDAEKRELQSVFDRPTPFTLNSLKLTAATPARLYASVWFRNPRDSSKNLGRTEEHYLVPQTHGGERQLLGFEKYLRQARILPSDMYVVPGSRAELDAYGNFKRGQWTKILSALHAAEHSAGYDANRTMQSVRRRGKAVGRKRKGKLIDYFAGRPKPGWPMGIWQKIGKNTLRPILIFVRTPRYRKRFNFYGIANLVSTREFDPLFRREMQRVGAAISMLAAA